MFSRVLCVIASFCLIASSVFADGSISGQPNTPDSSNSSQTNVPSTVSNSTTGKSNVSSLDNDEGYLGSVFLQNSKYGTSIDSGLVGKLNELTKGVERYNKEHQTLPGFQGTRDRDFAHLKSYTVFQQGLVSGLKIVLYLSMFVLLCRAGISLQMGNAEGAIRIGIGLTILIVVCTLLEPFFNLMAKLIM